MTIIFKAKTPEGHVFKILAELLQNNIKDACFEISDKGIRLNMMDKPQTILINLNLEAHNFSLYKFKSNKTLYIGVNLTHLHRMLRSIKKSDSIKLFIDDENPTDLGIKVIPKENNRVTTSFIKIRNVQIIQIDLPQGYHNPIIIPSGEFQKMIKGMSQISKTIDISAEGFIIRFACDGGGVMKRVVDFGETDDSDDEDSSGGAEDKKYHETFSMDKLSRVIKLSGLSTQMKIFPKSDEPLLFHSTVGSLGEISIYIKSEGQIDEESKKIDSDDED